MRSIVCTKCRAVVGSRVGTCARCGSDSLSTRDSFGTSSLRYEDLLGGVKVEGSSLLTSSLAVLLLSCVLTLVMYLCLQMH